jgi:cell division protein FtsB
MATAEGGGPMSPRVVRRASPLLAIGVVVGLFVLALFPTRTFLAQRRDKAAVEGQLQLLSRENKALEQRARLLHTDTEIERLAREQYNLVRPGEEAYAILPAPTKAPVAVLPGGLFAHLLVHTRPAG